MSDIKGIEPWGPFARILAISRLTEVGYLAGSEEGRARLLLIAGVRDAIREGLDLLGVSAPEQI